MVRLTSMALLRGTVALLLCCVACWVRAGGRREVIAFENGNWEGDGCTHGGLDLGRRGDTHALIVSGDRHEDYPPTIEAPITLTRQWARMPEVLIEIGIRRNSMQTRQGEVYWDGVLLAKLAPWDDKERLDTVAVTVEGSDFDLRAGTHVLKLVAGDTENRWDYLQVDSIAVGPVGPRRSCGRLLGYEVLPLAKGNWQGDETTRGGLDAGCAGASDRAAVRLVRDSSVSPGQFGFAVVLESDLSGRDVEVRVGLPRVAGKANRGRILWDGKLLAECGPLPPDAEGTIAVRRSAGSFDFSLGRHVVRFELCNAPDARRDVFVVDAIAVEETAREDERTVIALDELNIVPPAGASGIVGEAWRHFAERVAALGGSLAGNAAGRRSLRVRTGLPDSGVIRRDTGGLRPFQRREGFAITRETGGSIDVAGFGPMGTVYAISELELRLRAVDGQVQLDIPEWASAERSAPIVRIPALESRGEYINVGYDLPPITPHGWGKDRWEDYIDKLVLAGLNRFYFYVWLEPFTMYPGSDRSKTALSRKVHEGLRQMIRYAHKRGLDVTLMYCPTFWPKDVWLERPELHAEIEYVKHGFPVVCPRAPGAWERMIEIAESEMAWFAEADALQVWFYDPGGCFCEKHGCKERQAETLARQVKEFGELFRRFNPRARIEVSLWPIWLCQEMYGVQYREAFVEELKTAFPDSYGEITAVGAAGNSITMPLPEKSAGFRTSSFVFAANPESGYAFLMPNLRIAREAVGEAIAHGIDGCFGHRLEAWTRYPATFFMAQYMWTPDADETMIVRRLTDWLTAGPEAGTWLAEAILLLDTFTERGADPFLGQRMSVLTHAALEGLPEACHADLEYLPAMMDALKAIGHSAETSDPAALSALAEEFRLALTRSDTFASIRTRAMFDRYRGFLQKGSAKARF